MAARDRGTDLRLMPHGMTKRTENTTTLTSHGSRARPIPTEGSELFIRKFARTETPQTVFRSVAFTSGLRSYGVLHGANIEAYGTEETTSSPMHEQSRWAKRRSSRKRRRFHEDMEKQPVGFRAESSCAGEDCPGSGTGDTKVDTVTLE